MAGSFFYDHQCAAYKRNHINIERMLKSVVRNGGEIKACGGCSEARGIDSLNFIDGAQLSNMKALAQWTVECEKVITF